MERNILKIVGQIAGIGGVGFGVVLIVFRDVIQKSISLDLAKEQVYQLLRLTVILVWLLGVFRSSSMGVCCLSTRAKRTGEHRL